MHSFNNKSMTKTILITGSTDGIGKLAALKLAKAQHKIILHGRNASKLSEVIDELKQDSDNQDITGYISDFSDLSSVKSMAATLLVEQSQLDVLINNAGIFKSPVNRTDDGYDIRFAVNYLAPYILTNDILPLLKKVKAPRVVNLSSAAQAPVSLEGLKGNTTIGDQSAYAQSKLALTMWSFYLAKEQPELSVIAVNPGSLLNTNMVKEAYGRYWSSAEKGGNILYDLAISNEYAGVTGKYFDNDKGDPKGAFAEAHPEAYDELAIQQLIDTTNSLLT